MKDYTARKMGMPIEPIEDRIKNLVKINKSGCWEWQGQKNDSTSTIHSRGEVK